FRRVLFRSGNDAEQGDDDDDQRQKLFRQAGGVGLSQYLQDQLHVAVVGFQFPENRPEGGAEQEDAERPGKNGRTLLAQDETEGSLQQGAGARPSPAGGEESGAHVADGVEVKGKDDENSRRQYRQPDRPPLVFQKYIGSGHPSQG